MQRLWAMALTAAALALGGAARADDYYPLDAAHDLAGFVNRSTLTETGGLRAATLALVYRDAQGSPPLRHYALELAQQFD